MIFSSEERNGLWLRRDLLGLAVNPLHLARGEHGSDLHRSIVRDLLGMVVQPLDLHLVNVGSIPTGPTHGAGRLQPHSGDVLRSNPNVRRSPRSGLNLEGRRSDPQVVSPSEFASASAWPPWLICDTRRRASSEGDLAASENSVKLAFLTLYENL